jgi:MFS family permease
MHADKFMVGVILACFSGAQLVATPLLGSMSDRYGRRPVILFSLAGNAAAMALFVLAARVSLLPLLIASRTVAGATSGNLSACQAAIADVTEPARRSSAMGVIGAGLGLGLMAGPALGAVVVGRLGPQAPPLAATVMVLIDLVLALVLMPETRGTGPEEPTPSQARRPKPPIREVLSEHTMATLLAIVFLGFLAMTNMQTALPLMVVERLGWSSSQVGYMFAAFGLALFVVQGGLVGRLTRALGDMPLLVLGLMLETTGLLLIGYGPTTPPVLVGELLLGVGIGVTNPVMSALASKLARSDQQGAVLGVAQATGSLARTVGPLWSGFLYQVRGSVAAFTAGAIATGLASLLAVHLALRTRAARSSPAAP